MHYVIMKQLRNYNHCQGMGCFLARLDLRYLTHTLNADRETFDNVKIEITYKRNQGWSLKMLGAGTVRTAAQLGSKCTSLCIIAGLYSHSLWFSSYCNTLMVTSCRLS